MIEKKKRFHKGHRRLSIVIALCAVAGLTGGAFGMRALRRSGKEKKAHEPITIMAADRDYKKLVELVHKTYPQIRLEIQEYQGKDFSADTKEQLVSGEMPDIYTTDIAWDANDQTAHLVDLSRYRVSEMYDPVRLNEFDIDGGIYLLPYEFRVSGIGYNKTLLEKHHIDVPQSFRQLREETIPALKKAGIRIADCGIDSPESAFEQFFGVMDTGFLGEIEGRQWQKAYGNGQKNLSASGDARIKNDAGYFQQWIDCGMIKMNQNNRDALKHFQKGNTAFFVGNMDTFSEYDDGTGDQYGLMPYLSEDGSQNMYVNMISCCYGLNSALEQKGHEQKLQDALHVLEIMSGEEGCRALMDESSAAMCSVRDWRLPADSPYAEVLDRINKGQMASRVYDGWEDLIVPFGEKIMEWTQGGCSAQEALQALDDARAGRTPDGGQG